MQLDVKFVEGGAEMAVQLPDDSGQIGTEFGEVQEATKSGATFYPNVSDDGLLSWTNDQNLPNPAPVNIMGPAGRDGAQGPQGIQGPQGPQGNAGADGAQGPQGPQGIQGPRGETGPAGKDGVDGKNGADGRTPIKGTDYFTDADRAEMVAAVIAALPVYNGEVAD